MDLISNLAKEMQLHIMQFLPVKDAARMSVVSKSWKFLPDSFPVLVFLQKKPKEDKFIYSHYKGEFSFSEFLDEARQRFSRKRVFVEQLNLCVTFYPSEETIGAVSRWIQLAIGKNLRTLKLKVKCTWAFYPSCIELLDALSASKTLTTLHLSRFQLTPTRPIRHWKFPRLQRLSLVYMSLDSSAVQDLVSSCPLLEQLDLIRIGVTETRLELSSLGNVKRVEVELDGRFYIISILRATRLESFICRGLKDSRYFNHLPAGIELGGCEASLKELRISNVKLLGKWVETKIPKFRNLKVLALQSIENSVPATLKISSTELTELILTNSRSVTLDPEMCAPNLRKLEIGECPFHSLKISQSLQSVNLKFQVTKDMNKYGLYDKLEYFFHKIKHINNVVVCFICLKPEIAVLQEGHSATILDTLYDLYDSMTKFELIISSDRNWYPRVVSHSTPNRIYIVSSIDNDDSHLSEYLEKEVACARRNARDSRRRSNVESIAIETEYEKPQFGEDVDSQYALLKVFPQSSFRLTRYVLNWSFS